VFPQIVIVDEFMRRVKQKQEWTLVDPYEVNCVLGFELAELWGDRFDSAYAEVEQACEDGRLKLFNRVNARELFKEAMRTQVETGLPYMSFKDTINRLNPNKHDGYIPATNLCVESFSNVKPGKFAHTCNLVSLNLANIDDDLAHHCETSVRILDNTIDLTHAPFEASQNHNDHYRTIGVGAMGLADWLAKRRLKYSDRTAISTLFEDMGYHCTRYSMELAQERGTYPAFEGSEWSQGKLLGGRDLDWINTNAAEPERWHTLAQDIQTHGIRNSHITAIAPNTSSSLVQGCTASILPTYSKFYYDKWAKGVVPIAPPFIGDRFWFYTENKVMDQRLVVDAVATIQQWIDTGISMELLFNLNENVYREGVLTAKDIYETLVHAWESGCKAIYYIRTVQKDNYKESDSCVACAN
jgi:ribonucleoside-diphosphate reductase alpha chain